MRKLSDFDIPFSGLSLGEHLYDFDIGMSFFEAFEVEQEFSDCSVAVKVSLTKSNHLLDISFSIEGSVEVPCDITNKPFSQPIKNTWNLVVKFSEEAQESNDEDILILAFGDHTLNIAQQLYEGILLSIPMKRVSPEGKSISDAEGEIIRFENAQAVDPRWEKLRKLI